MSLFCGACSIETKLADHFERVICNDNHEYLIAMLSAVKDGWIPPDRLSEEEYTYIRTHKEENPALTGFVGFGCSFGGKWFGGYARTREKNRNYCSESQRALLRDAKHWQNIEFICSDYRDVTLPDGCVVYADPPYDNTTQYWNGKFSSADFWEYARTTSKDHLMFISEQNAPDDFVPIWSQVIKRTLDRNSKNYFSIVEYLYVHKTWYEKLRLGESNEIN